MPNNISNIGMKYISSFRINSDEIKVYLINDMYAQEEYYGWANPDNNWIILNEYLLQQASENEWLQTLWHEICHVIHAKIKYKDEYKDEKLTDLLASAFIEAKIYDIESDYSEFTLFGVKVIIENHYRNEVDYNYNIIYADIGGLCHDEKLIFKLKLILRFILYKYGYDKLSYDDTYLNLFSRALYQVIRSSNDINL